MSIDWNPRAELAGYFPSAAIDAALQVAPHQPITSVIDRLINQCWHGSIPASDQHEICHLQRKEEKYFAEQALMLVTAADIAGLVVDYLPS